MVFFEKNAINFLSFKDRARRELLSCLDACPGTKALVWDDYLIGPFSLVAEYSVLQEHQVSRMFTLEKSEFPTNLDFTSMVFLVRSELKVIKKLAKFIKKAGTVQKSSNIPKLYVYFVPAVSTVCKKALIEMCPSADNLVEDFRECAIGAIPLETDLLSLELESSFRDLYLDEDPSPLHHLATTLNAIQQMYGVIPNIYGKGKYAKQLIDMVGKMGKDAANSEWNIASRFDNLFVIDRNVDLITLMPTQLTYEGLVDECFGITQATVRLPADKFPNTGQSSKTPAETDSGKKDAKDKKITLNSTDELYAEIRDKNFSAVGPVFSAKTKFLSAKMGERYSAKEVAEMKEFVAKMPHLLALKQSLTTFMTIAEIIKPLVNNDDFLESLEVQQSFLSGVDTDKIHPVIEQLIARCEPFEKVIRLIALQSEINGGLKPPVLTQYKRDLIQSYGFEEIVTLNNLEKAGFFRTTPKKWFRVAKETLKLFVGHAEDGTPKDFSYIYSGYAPLSVRLARQLVHPGWKSIQDVLDAMPGDRVEAKQKVADHLRKRRNSIGSTMSGSDEPPLVTLVVFVGGVTYSEVSALRFLSNQEESSTIFYVLTTQMINGSTIIESLRETMKPSIL